MRKLSVFVAVVLVSTGAAAVAQPAGDGSAAPPAVAPLPAPADIAPAAPTDAPTTCPATIPALTQVELAIDIALGSKTSQTGQVFPLHLAEPIVIGGCELAPAGATGEGEVIHAKRAGAAGSSGELVLAARYVMVDGSRLELRSMKVGMAGKDNVQTATAVAPVIGVFSFAISGKNAEYPQGTRAIAKTRADFPLTGERPGTSSRTVDAQSTPAPATHAQPPEPSVAQAP